MNILRETSNILTEISCANKLCCFDCFNRIEFDRYIY